MIKAFVGAGGKTTFLKQEALLRRSRGEKVLVTTTTHMFIEEGTLLTDDADEIIAALGQKSLVMAGLPLGRKIGPLSPATYAAVCARADAVLVEADGAKHMTIKFPAPHEPVIPENADEIAVVCGLHALGRPLREAAHRVELVQQCLKVPADTIITPEHIRKLVMEGYILPLKKKYPEKRIFVLPNHDGSHEQMEIAKWLEDICK